ncbi:MAG: T9SS type A sorting domain-containing protein, partial [Bacteroidales bacterium]|nr:T9SS type A sorting domain-containing protein [Bacteroidales bacterium]
VHPDKTIYKKTEDKILRLNVSGAEGGDQTAVRFKALSTEGFDSHYDARKLCGGFGIPQLYSVTSDAVEMAINTLPSIEENGLVNIGFAADIPDLYEITATEIENFDQNTAIYLEDIFENNTIDLRVVPAYTFTYNTGDDPDRFRLHFSNTMNNHDTDGTSATIYSAGNNIYINGLAHEKIIRIEIFNIIGQKILEKISRKNGFQKIIIREGTGIFIVRITADGKTIVKKVYIN